MTLQLPNGLLVASAWLTLALPDVGNDERLPAVNQAIRTVGFIRLVDAGGTLNPTVRLREPVFTAECWFAPPAGDDVPPWNKARNLAERVIAACDDRTLMARTVSLGAAFQPANVRTVAALNEPRKTPDPSKWARFDVDLHFAWTGA